MNPDSTKTSTSRKVIFSLEYFQVKFKVEELLRLFRNSFNDSTPCCQIKKMSSMNLNHFRGLSFCFERNLDSNNPMKRLAYDGAMRVPIAVPFICKYSLSLNLKAFIVNIKVTRFKRNVVEGFVLVGLVLR